MSAIAASERHPHCVGEGVIVKRNPIAHSQTLDRLNEAERPIGRMKGSYT